MNDTGSGFLWKVSCFLQNDIEIPIPKYFIHENNQAIKEREKMMGTVIAGMKQQESAVQVISHIKYWVLQKNTTDFIVSGKYLGRIKGVRTRMF